MLITGLISSIVTGGIVFWWLHRMYGGHLAPSEIVQIVAGFATAIIAISLLLFPVITGVTGKLGRLVFSLFHSNMETLEFMGNMIARREDESDAHNYRVTLYAVRLAEVVGLEGRQIQGLIKGAFLHDVGKLGLRDTILLKPDRLDSHEIQAMKDHTKYGMKLVTRSQWLDDANQVVAYHHERFDGTGYFAGLRGEEIPLVARIFTIANVFEALTTRRPYKDPLPLDKALEILDQDKGTHFDPDLVDTFSSIIPDLYNDCHRQDEDSLKQVLSSIKERYFRETTVFH